MGRYKFQRRRETTVEEVRAMMEGTDDAWFKALLAVLYLYGVRISEALAMTKEDLVMEGGYLAVTVRIKKARNKGPYGEPVHVLRVNAKSPFVEDVIAPYLESVMEPSARLFPRTPVAVWYRLKKVGVNISSHIFRHDRLEKLSEMGASGPELMDWAGWSDMRPATNYLRRQGKLAAKFSDDIS